MLTAGLVTSAIFKINAQLDYMILQVITAKNDTQLKQQG